MTLINPVKRAELFDHADWTFETKFDRFRASADTVRGRLVSRNGNRMKRFERVLDLLSKGHVFDDELVVLDDAGRPLLIADGIDLRPLPLRERKGRLARLGDRAEGWIDVAYDKRYGPPALGLR